MNRPLTPRYYRRDRETTRPKDTAAIPRTTKNIRSDKNAAPLRIQTRNERMEESHVNKLNPGKHDSRIPNGISENDPCMDHFTSKNHLRSVNMYHQRPNSKKLPMKDGTKGRLLIGRRNRSKTSFEYSESSNELRIPFEVYPNTFEVPIRLHAQNFGFLRILEGRSSNDFELIRMNPPMSPA